MANAQETEKSMEAIVALAKRRGFVYPASEIYGGINGFWDYGPLGVLLKNNLRDAWWNDMVIAPPLGPDGHPLSIVGLDSSIIQNPRTWEASGHVGGFNDPMQTCRQCKKLFRADHVADFLRESTWANSLKETVDLVSAEGIVDLADAAKIEQTLRHWAKDKGRKVAKEAPLVRTTNKVLEKLHIVLGEHKAPSQGAAHAINSFPRPFEVFLRLLGDAQLRAEGIEAKGPASVQPPCPNCMGTLTEPRQFNLMFQSYAGAVQDDSSKVYLRPETAQGIFLNYKNVLDTMRVKVPFGIAQVGKAFRNEVTPRNFIFRSREFEQMEMEWFCEPKEAGKWYEFWVEARLAWWRSLGVSAANLIRRDHAQDELAHYSSKCADIEYRYPFTAPKFGELEGIAHRGDYDLKQHQEHAKAKLEYFDEETRARFLPHVIEPAAGLTRGMLVILCEAYHKDPARPSPEYLKFHQRLAPIKAGIFPLVNKDGMPEIAEKLYLELRQKHVVQYDAKQTIGKRYARMDEAGTPYCFTVDGETLTNQTVTVRDRDTTAQERVNVSQVAEYLAKKLSV